MIRKMFSMIGVMALVLGLIASLGGSASAEHDDSFPADSDANCDAVGGERVRTEANDRACIVQVDEWGLIQTSENGFSRSTHTTGEIVYVTYRADRSHDTFDNTETSLGACYDPDGNALGEKAASKNPNCQLPAE